MSTDSASELSYHDGRSGEEGDPELDPPNHSPVPRGRRRFFFPREDAMPTDGFHNPIGVYGWRKRCLYFFILLLVVIIVVNLGLTVWIIVVMDFNVDGMGKLRITDDGLRLEGRAEFIDPLYAQTISADQESSLQLQSHQSIDITSGNSLLQLGPNTLNVTTDSFQVLAPDGSGSPLFSVSAQGVSVAAGQLQAEGTLGVSVDGPVETGQVRSHPGEELKVEAPSGSLRMVGSQGVSVRTGGVGDVEVSAFGDISLVSQNGKIVLEAQELNLRDLPIGSVAGSPTSNVYEVCVCESGRIYLVSADLAGGCEAGSNICET